MLGNKRCVAAGSDKRSAQPPRIVDPYACSTSNSGPPPAGKRHVSRLSETLAARRLTVCQSTSDPSTTDDIPSSTSTSGPWTEQDLMQLSDSLQKEQEDALGLTWRNMFEHDPSLLFFHSHYVAEEWENKAQDGLESQLPITSTLANELIGIGTWRLKGTLDPVISYMVKRIESTWREQFMEDLSIYPRPLWKHKYDICDSMDPARDLDGWSYGDIPDPEKGTEGYPRLVLENRIYSSRVFRKLHIEVGARQDGLQVLHVVLYPRYCMDLPILAMDMVAKDGKVSLAIVDACPISKDLSLPEQYLKTMHELQDMFLTNSDNQRQVPEWGSRIFSKACVLIRPSCPEDLSGFISYAVALHSAHCLLAGLVEPTTDEKKLQEMLDGHKRFVDNQLANKSTSAVLDNAFGKEFTEAYMKDVMFDFTPGNEPPYEDMSIVRLYNYFEEYPEWGPGPERTIQLNQDVALDRAEETLERLFNGEPVRQDQCEDALQTMFAFDEPFRESCLKLVPDLADDPRSVGAKLARNMEALGLGKPLPRWTLTK